MARYSSILFTHCKTREASLRRTCANFSSDCIPFSPGFDGEGDENDEEENHLLAVLGNLVPNQDADDQETASDSDLSEAFDMLQHAFSSPTFPGEGETSNNGGSMDGAGAAVDEEFGRKECLHCKCTHGYRADIGAIGPFMDATTKKYFDSYGPADVTLVAEDVEIPCHKDVLGRCSDYFAAMFGSRMVESTQEKVELKDVRLRISFLLRKKCFVQHVCGNVTSSHRSS